MYNVNAGMQPSHILDLMPPLVSEISDYPFRNNRNISLPFNKTNISQKSIRLWNGLGNDFKNLPTLTTFKNM